MYVNALARRRRPQDRTRPVPRGPRREVDSRQLGRFRGKLGRLLRLDVLPDRLSRASGRAGTSASDCNPFSVALAGRKRGRGGRAGQTAVVLEQYHASRSYHRNFGRRR